MKSTDTDLLWVLKRLSPGTEGLGAFQWPTAHTKHLEFCMPSLTAFLTHSLLYGHSFIHPFHPFIHLFMCSPFLSFCFFFLSILSFSPVSHFSTLIQHIVSLFLFYTILSIHPSIHPLLCDVYLFSGSLRKHCFHTMEATARDIR